VTKWRQYWVTESSKTVDGKSKHIHYKYHKTREAAVNDYDQMAKKFYGKFALINT
jgi:hypothetical protein